MIVDRVKVHQRDDRVERTATITSARGEFDLAVAGPPALVDSTDDASSFLAAVLPLAMRLGEDIRVVGPVSPRLLDRCDELQAIYRAWAPFMGRISITADADAGVAEAGRMSAAFFSRGVDSVFMAARGSFDALVFTDGLEPLHGADTRAPEIAHAREQADRLERPMHVVETNLRSFSDPIIRDWEDMCGAGLSMVALALARGVDTMQIASSDTYESIEPAGTSPLLDPLFSTERVAIVHDTLAFTRLDKIRWLAEHRPDLIGDLKVCYAENRVDNCGRCGKCMITMACLHLVDRLADATQFPSTLDLDTIAAMNVRVPKACIDWAEIARVDDDKLDGRLRAAVRAALRRSVHSGHTYELDGRSLWMEPRSFRTHRVNLMLSALVDGVPYPDNEAPRGG